MHRLNALIPHGASTVVESEVLLSSIMEGLRASVPAGNSKGVYDENLASKQFKSLVSSTLPVPVPMPHHPFPWPCPNVFVYAPLPSPHPTPHHPHN